MYVIHEFSICNCTVAGEVHIIHFHFIRKKTKIAYRYQRVERSTKNTILTFSQYVPMEIMSQALIAIHDSIMRWVHALRVRHAFYQRPKTVQKKMCGKFEYVIHLITFIDYNYK